MTLEQSKSVVSFYPRQLDAFKEELRGFVFMFTYNG